MADEDIESMNPGIRRTVAWLRSIGFITCDSGDGKTHEYACDRDEPYVVMNVDVQDLVCEANRLLRAIEGRGIDVSPIGEGAPAIQASYDPTNGIGVLDLMGLDDDMLEGTRCAVCGRGPAEEPCVARAGYRRPR